MRGLSGLLLYNGGTCFKEEKKALHEIHYA